MDIVKRACIAYNHILLNQPEDQRDQTLAMKAAIRAMLEGLEPVAWRYENDDRTHNPVTVINVTRWRGHAGWTETPLYDLSALKEVVG